MDTDRVSHIFNSILALFIYRRCHIPQVKGQCLCLWPAGYRLEAPLALFDISLILLTELREVFNLLDC